MLNYCISSYFFSFSAAKQPPNNIPQSFARDQLHTLEFRIFSRIVPIASLRFTLFIL